MIELKVQCDCGQKFKFDVEPVNGQMPFRVNCPICGADGTDKANSLLQQMAPARVAPPGAPPLPVASPPLAIGTRTAAAPAPATATRFPAAAAGALTAARSQVQKGKDGWATPQTGVHKLGSYIVLGPSMLGAMLAAGFFGLEVSPLVLGAIVGVCGVVGGAVNIMGRGPIPVGMLVGLTMALGGYGAVFWWISDKTSFRKYELMIAFLIGAAPGFGLQFAFQKFLQKRQQQGRT